MLPDKDIGCHRTGFVRKCRDLVTQGICNRWKHVPLQNPTADAAQLQYDCIDNWMFTLQLHQLKLQCETGAALDSLRNEAGKRQNLTNDLLAHGLGLPAVLDLSNGRRNETPLLSGTAGTAIDPQDRA